MKNLITIFLFTISTFLFGQDLNWKLEKEISIKDIDVWTLDRTGNVMYAQKDAIYRLDTMLNLQFSQSLKELGAISIIDAAQAQKSLVFSEDMQQIAFLDNTLSFTDRIIDLSDKGVNYARFVSYSVFNNRYWVYDEFNYSIKRFDLNGDNPSVLENINLVIDKPDLIDFFEINKKLCLVDKNRGVYLFDMYGVLISHTAIEAINYVSHTNDIILVQTADGVLKINEKGWSEKMAFPALQILDFKIIGNYVFIRTKDSIKKYSVKFR